MHKRITSVMDIFILSSDGKGALRSNCTDKYQAALCREPDMITRSFFPHAWNPQAKQPKISLINISVDIH
jgi:hypothetical protein